jgi:hypothetical protein
MQTLTPKLMMTEDKFHGYVGHVAILKDCDYKSGKIIGGEGIKLYMQSIDGTVFECYHDNIEYIWGK